MNKKSLQIYILVLITPFLIWFTLWSIAKNTFHAHDPNPWIQGLVNSPGQKIFPPPTPNQSPTDGTTTADQTQWIRVVADAGELFVTTNTQNKTIKIPLQNFVPTAQRLILLTEVHGPQLASLMFRFLKEKNLLKRCLVLAVSDGFLKDMRFFDGEIALGAGQAYLVRFRALQTFGLENFLSVQMSGIWLRPEIFKQSTQQLTDTFHTMQVPVFIGPVTEEQILSLPKNANYLVEK